MADCQVIVDCASSSSSAAVGEIMKRIDADAMIVSCQTDMRQRGSWSAPEEGNMSSLRKIVTANYGSIGVALNSDGTRLTGIDEHGDVISGDALLQIFVKYLQPRKMTVPIDTTIAVKELIKGKVEYCGLAPENIGETVKMDDLEMGGSGYGSFVFSDISYATDGIAAAALLTKIASDYSLRDMTKEFPVYHRREDSVRYTSNREIIARNINSRISELDYSELCVTDGWRVEMESGWFLIRFSDDSTDIDIKVEGVDKMYSAGLLEIARDIVVSSVKAAQ